MMSNNTLIELSIRGERTEETPPDEIKYTNSNQRNKITVNNLKYTNLINRLLPNAKIIKLKGYSKGNRDYQKAKTPVGMWKSEASLCETQIDQWLDQDGWIGAVIPSGRVIVDIDSKKDGKLLKNLLEGEKVHHHTIQTPNGFQFIFGCENNINNDIKQVSKYVNRLGLLVDTRTSENGYIVFPTKNTKGRFVVTKCSGKLDEIPQYLRLVWNGYKNKNYPVYPINSKGSRNTELFDFARRLFHLQVPKKETCEALQLIYKYFVTNKQGFSIQEINILVNSAFKKVWQGNTGEQSRQVSNIEYKVESNETYKEKKIPEPFVIIEGSLYKKEIKKEIEVKKMVSRKTPIITKEFRNIEEPQVLYEIEWNERNRKVNVVVPASTLAVKKDLLALSEKGFSVNENNAKTLIEYFDMYLAQNEINEYYAVERLGSIKDKFIHPILSKNIEIMALDQGERQLLEGFKRKGTSSTWSKEVFERIKKYPKAVFFVLASFTSVIIKDLRVQPFIIDLSGSTSQGKTTTLKVASSVWGNGDLINEWNATKVAIERKAAYLNNFPLLLDDTRKAEEQVLKTIIYQFSGGKSKGRGSLKGSQKEYTWNNILLSTGEVSIADYAKNHGGASARVIPLVDEPLKKDNSNIMQLHEAVDNNYGVIGLQFLKIWLEDKDEFLPEYQKFKMYYIEKAKDNEVLIRLAGYYATVHFTGRILKNRLGIDIDLQAISALFDEILKENKGTDKPLQFFEEILSDLDSSRQDIFYNWEPQVNKAIYKNGLLYLMPAYIKRYLGVEERSIRREWLKRGFSIGELKKDVFVDYKAIKHKGKTYRAIPINMSLVKELGFNFDERI